MAFSKEKNEGQMYKYTSLYYEKKYFVLIENF